MLAFAIARWFVAVQLAAPALVGGFLPTAHVGLLLHASPPTITGATAAFGTAVAALVGILIVPAAHRRIAGYVLGGIPIACGVLALLGGRAGHALTAATVAGVQALVLTGCVVVMTFRRQRMAAA
jgi:hypothetical protein